MDPLAVLPAAGPIDTTWEYLPPEDLARAARVRRTWFASLLQHCRRRVCSRSGVFYAYRLLLRSCHVLGADAGKYAELEAAQLCRATLRWRGRTSVVFETWLKELSERACARCLTGRENVRLCGDDPPLPLCRPCRTQGAHALSLVRSTEVFEGAVRAFDSAAAPALTRSAPARGSLMRHVRKTLDPVRINDTVFHYFRPALLRATDHWWRTKGAKRWGRSVVSALSPPPTPAAYCAPCYMGWHPGM